MFWNTIAILSLLVGIALVWSVLLKKFPQLKLIDLSTLAKERHREVKARIIRDRFERQVGSLGAKAGGFVSGMSGALSSAYEQARTRLKKLENRFDNEKATGTPEEQEAHLVKLLDEAVEHTKLRRFGMAEDCLIEALRLDPKRAETYRGLADVYLAQDMSEQARETLEFLVRLRPDDAAAFESLGQVEQRLGRHRESEAYLLHAAGLSERPARTRASLGETYLSMQEPRKAQEQYRLALEVEPYHPGYLDAFIETSILLGDAISAEEAYVTLETADPENGKLTDFRSRIDTMRAIQA